MSDGLTSGGLSTEVAGESLLSLSAGPRSPLAGPGPPSTGPGPSPKATGASSTSTSSPWAKLEYCTPCPSTLFSTLCRYVNGQTHRQTNVGVQVCVLVIVCVCVCVTHPPHPPHCLQALPPLPDLHEHLLHGGHRNAITRHPIPVL